MRSASSVGAGPAIWMSRVLVERKYWDPFRNVVQEGSNSKAAHTPLEPTFEEAFSVGAAISGLIIVSRRIVNSGLNQEFEISRHCFFSGFL